ncbi:toxin ParE1/3/4 [Ereboglobus sp. PH5-10]|uniref:type II toxin-antitoxin system RelE/ParE family toxin n=1 Tax=Ereboglobus sp. PH5-10 TaxID=2940629 RepID=UPI002406EB27|nr:type II toxin-antitoxin system RelE/ParE family toxin [Ereboglobus sp. PH5-10]MDF9827744.1 toxin ParE1/3/4 [Ereboglobus sp. PH5-10]
MKRIVRIAPNAEADLRAAFGWYEQCDAGLGFAFLQTIETKLAELARAPQLFRKRAGAYRLATTRRFPYGIYFIWDETSDTISVRRVLHFRQNPRAADL